MRVWWEEKRAMWPACEECFPSTPGMTNASWFITVMMRSVMRPIIV